MFNCFRWKGVAPFKWDEFPVGGRVVFILLWGDFDAARYEGEHSFAWPYQAVGGQFKGSFMV